MEEKKSTVFIGILSRSTEKNKWAIVVCVSPLMWIKSKNVFAMLAGEKIMHAVPSAIQEA